LLHLIRLKKPATTVTAIEQHRNNLVWVATGNLVAVYNPNSLSLLAQWEAHTTTLKFIKSMGPNIWTMSNTGDVSIWTLEADSEISLVRRIPCEGIFYAHRRSPTRAWMGYKSLILWNTESLEPVQELEGQASNDHITAVVSLQQYSWAVTNSGTIITYVHNNPDELSDTDQFEASELVHLEASFTKKEFEQWVRQVLSGAEIGTNRRE